MEEDDDDFYGGAAGRQEHATKLEDDGDEKMDVTDEEEEEDSEDDVEFTLEKPESAKTEPVPSKAKQQKPVSDPKPGKSGTPIKSEPVRASSTAPSTLVKGTLTHNGKEGKDFLETRSSKLDVNNTPTWPGNGKLITEVDIDADLAEASKLWRLPGTDITDFFNYGFDEYTWTQYCIKQQTMGGTISDLKQQDAQMKAMFGGGPGGGMPPMPPGMPGMPDPQQMMEMMQSGNMPPEMMQMMSMMPGMGGPGMGAQGQFQQGGGFGSGQNSASPNPQQGQGFQPPQGPSAGQGPGGFAPNIEGYSPQQLAIMQQEQGGFQGGGGRGRGKRGRW